MQPNQKQKNTEAVRPKIITLIICCGTFLASLLSGYCFCSENTCRLSVDALFGGWFAMGLGGSGNAWMANPLLLASWILIFRSAKSSLILSFFACLFSL